jgi:hypothetical protein
MAYSLRSLILALFILHVPLLALAAVDMEELLPPVSCGADWKIEGKLSFYDRDTLSDRINGEAELYFPYGFDRMAAARYASVKKTGAGMDVEIYRMGSLLDAFGMYANYKQKEGHALGVGAESNLSGSQLFLYQGRYFVHLQVTGNDSAASYTIAECARSVASRLPGDNNRPAELSILKRQEVVSGTERYLPQSLLGYDFLNRGIMSDAIIGGTSFQIFLLLDTTAESASIAFERFRSQLAKEKSEPGGGGKGSTFLEGIDPLYGSVIILKKGSCLAGALKFSVNKGVRTLLENVCK